MHAAIRRTVRMLKFGAIAGAVVGIVRAVRSRKPPDVVGQATWPPLTEPPKPERRDGPVQFAEPMARAWVEPVDGACPASHPIKGNEQSGIFHVPGGLSYDRTVPERCYASEEDAEADGFRRSKR